MNTAGSRRYRLGLTGGIGSGKTTAGRRLQARGAELIDADALSRATTAAGGPAIPALVAAFGPQIVTAAGALDRARMRALAFADPSARRRLEAIVHPLVHAAMAAQEAASHARCVVFDVPLLVESGHWPHRLDSVLVIDCTEDTQIRRVQARSGWEAAAVQDVMRSQASRSQRLAAADSVIFNDVDDIDRLHAAIDRLSARFGL